MAHNRRCLLVLAVALVLCLVNAWKPMEFITSDMAGFALRNRGRDSAQSWRVSGESCKAAAGVLTCDMKNDERAEDALQLEVFALKNRTFRIRIDEPARPRYRVNDVLVAEPTVDEGAVFDVGAEAATCNIGATSFRLAFHPLILQWSVAGKNVITLNARHMFNVECKRERPSDEAALVPGEWKRKVIGEHSEEIPNGPSSVSLDVRFDGSTHVYGIPERPTKMSLKPTRGEGIVGDPYRLYNLDVHEHATENPMGLYGAIPVMLAHDKEKTSGVFWLNASETWVDVEKDASMGRDTHWFSESGLIDLFVFLGPTADDVFRQYTTLTGTSILPPQFSTAFHQCRWNYRDEEDVAQVNAGFEQYDMPLDVIWLDIEHTDGKRYMTWDKNAFKTPIDMQDKIAAYGRKMVTIVDPHMKKVSDYAVFNEAQSKGYFVKTKDGADFEGHCWPGASQYLDVTNPEIREWWGTKFTKENYEGSTDNLYIWNDMNEPSVFNGPEVTMQKHNLHMGNIEHRELHNLYGFYYHMATADGLSKARGNTRPFVLSRAFFAGTQRYGPIWTGDNMAKWEHIQLATQMLLTLNLAGLPFVGADVGGFFFNPEPELMVRWFQAGAFYPFFRAHAHLETKRREPYLAEEPYRSHMRDAIRTKYHFLPYWYTLFYQSHTTGSPLLRPLWVEFPGDEDTFEIDDAFLVGKGLLVKPVTKEGVESVQMYLPGDDTVWYAFDSGLASAGGRTITANAPLRKIPVFIRGGYIIPRKERVRRTSAAMTHDPLTLYVALDKQGMASGDLYVDDSISYEYKEKKAYMLARFDAGHDELKNTVVHNGYPTTNTVERVIVYGVAAAPAKVTVTSPSVGTKDLLFEYTAEKGRLTIRKPATLVNEEWTVKWH